MRVLWITNQPIGEAANKINLKANSGTWMEPSLDELKGDSNITIGVASMANVDRVSEYLTDNVTYYYVPRSHKKIYPYMKKKEKRDWKGIIDKFSPDLLMIWGTEYAHGLCAINQASGIPVVVMIQGILDTIERYYLGGMTKEELCHAYTIRNFIKHDSIRNEKKLYKKKARYEKEIIKLSGHVMIENEWAASNILRIAPECRLYYCKQKINSVFLDKEWSVLNCTPHTIFCTAPVGYPLKGFHFILKALPLIKKKYPNVTLRVPGLDDPYAVSLYGKLKRTGYIKYIMDLINKNGLRDNVIFLGRLNSEQMADELLKANVYIASSYIENQSSSLREAMAVGTPAVVSFAGGMPELLHDRENARIYRSEEYSQLAYIVSDLFENSSLCVNMSRNARATIRRYWEEPSQNAMTQIYREILEGK